jgi:hypothetical protein
MILYDMAWAGLWLSLDTNLIPWISSSKDRFNKIDQLFDRVAALQFKSHDKKPGRQHLERQAGVSQRRCR